MTQKKKQQLAKDIKDELDRALEYSAKVSEKYELFEIAIRELNAIGVDDQSVKDYYRLFKQNV